MKKEYFILKGIKYQIDNANVHIDIEENGLRLFLEVNASTDNDSIDSELCNLQLYHNNGFQTGVSKIEDLKGKKYSWPTSENDKGEEAGYLYVLEHENVTKGNIEIIDVLKDKVIVKWEGLANIFWNEEFNENVPFETVFVCNLPKNKKICINAYKTNEYKIDNNLKIVLINFKRIELAAKIMQLTKKWQSFNTTLKFKIIYNDKEYLGKVTYKNGKNNYETILDEKCPIQIKHSGFEWSTIRKEFNFTFEIISKMLS